ncbi:putative UPF0556 protein C19orf10-like [Apostichopus japonicus]|uniref:Putative UPF0556 protein C19orf10-like n=2 Tax=Stichopus japonicus TaxID=307972 RepID=A0A2G8JNX9_STIJA|nr:putative UPF0556 protein C19orf10-like [Apostichopus japonicus]
MALYQLTSLLLFASLLYVSRADEKQSTNHHFFKVQPGGEMHIVSRNLGPFECAFTYAAQGGTNEEWFFDLDADHDGKLYTCSIGRPSGSSYLVFTQFKVEINGANLKDVELYSSQGEKLGPEEYNLNKEEHTVSSVEGGFQSQLARIHVLAQGVKTEL